MTLLDFRLYIRATKDCTYTGTNNVESLRQWSVAWSKLKERLGNW